jgi:hypothetical protein
VDFIAYCREKRLNVDVVDYLARHPVQKAAFHGDDIAIRVMNTLMAPIPPETDLGLQWEEPPEDFFGVEGSGTKFRGTLRTKTRMHTTSSPQPSST